MTLMEIYDVLYNHVPLDVLEARNTYRSCVALAEISDSKRETEVLLQDAKIALAKLTEKCEHPTIVITQGYSPAYSSYDEPDPEIRLCICCGLYESAYREFHTLLTRPFARVFATKGLPIELREPLRFLMTECIEAAVTSPLGHKIRYDSE